MSDKRPRRGASARRERGRREMVEAIVKTAEEIVAENGTDALTIRAVANALGYSPGALYEYFDSKEAILLALYFKGTGGLDACCQAVVERLPDTVPAPDAVAELGRTYRTYALDNAEVYRLGFCAVRAPHPEELEHIQSEPGTFAILVDTVQRGIREGTIVDLPPVEIAFALWAAVHGFVSLEISGYLTGGVAPGAPVDSPEEGKRRRDHQFEQMLRVTLHGFASDARQSDSAT